MRQSLSFLSGDGGNRRWPDRVESSGSCSLKLTGGDSDTSDGNNSKEWSQTRLTARFCSRILNRWNGLRRDQEMIFKSSHILAGLEVQPALCTLQDRKKSHRPHLFRHGAVDCPVVRGDRLRNPAFFTGDGLATNDYVSANPLFSLENCANQVWTSS